jgi:hypothetical protein
MVNAFTMKISYSSNSGKLLQLSDGTNTDNLVINSVIEVVDTSLKSSLTQSGRGVPQYRFLEIFQSWAFPIQFANRFSCTNEGTLDVNLIQ